MSPMIYVVVPWHYHKDKATVINSLDIQTYACKGCHTTNHEKTF